MSTFSTILEYILHSQFQRLLLLLLRPLFMASVVARRRSYCFKDLLQFSSSMSMYPKNGKRDLPLYSLKSLSLFWLSKESVKMSFKELVMVFLFLLPRLCFQQRECVQKQNKVACPKSTWGVVLCVNEARKKFSFLALQVFFMTWGPPLKLESI